MTSELTQSPAWKTLQTHQAKMRGVKLRDLFAQDPQRAARYTFSLNGLSVDLSRNHLTDETIALLIQLALTQGLKEWREKLFKGYPINNSEGRAVLHTALRTASNDPVMADGKNVIPEIRKLQERMAAFSREVREGRWLGATGQPVEQVVNIGIGGSDLGPRLAVSALRPFADGPRPHFVANVDAADLLGVLARLDPATTLFVVVSKTFSTQETLLNAKTAREWLTDQLGQSAVAKHFSAASMNEHAAQEFGISPANMFPMWDWVGGRFSLWSSVGLSVALTLGWNNFKAMLDGAALMDEHFRTAPLTQNLPVLLGLTGLWYRNFWGTTNHAFLPYGERLRDFPRYLQQLEMESNGKSVTRDGSPVNYSTSSAIIGECGTISQHSFHQWLHQGTDLTPLDFIGILQDDLGQPEHHAALLENLKAQAEALMQGCQEAETYRSNPGNKPSTLLWLDRLNPFNLGMLLALYEHKVFVQGIVWGINSFDQWGVELGKKLAGQALSKT